MSLLKSANNKYTMFPIEYKTLWDFYKKHEATFWTVEEVRLTDDLVDWNKKLNENERYFIKNVLAFFAASDGIVNENLVVNFYNDVEISEARSFYTVQMMMESIHSEQYSVLIDTYITDTIEKDKLFNAIETIPAIKKKADWAIKWITRSDNTVQERHKESCRIIKEILEKGGECDSNLIESMKKIVNENDNTNTVSFEQRLLAFICVEGIFFSGSFCAIYWLKNRGLMPGLSTANQFISRDENLHAEFAIELYRLNGKILPVSIVHAIFKESVDIEKEFVTESLPVSLIGMNCKLMNEYIEYVADRWLVLLGYPKLYNTQNPFSFMELISLGTKENFFELNVTEYSRANVGTTSSDREISFESDF
jgi:ribonucleoside-diphosphate reductase beta chain